MALDIPPTPLALSPRFDYSVKSFKTLSFAYCDAPNSPAVSTVTPRSYRAVTP